jgi:arsenate reductase (glutaredoxin)
MKKRNHLMAIVVYLYSKCSTCQKALRFIEQKKIEYVVKEIKDTPPSIQELQQMLSYKDGDIKKLFNTSGLLYGEMGLTQKLQDMSLTDALKLLHSNGMLVKRPFLLADGFGLIGFREKEWQQVL